MNFFNQIAETQISRPYAQPRISKRRGVPLYRRLFPLDRETAPRHAG